MSDHDDPLLDPLNAMDPTLSDPPPATGSIRFTTIKEHAMQTLNSQTKSRPILWRRARPLMAAAAVIAVVALGAALLNLGSATGAAATVRAAAGNTAEATDFRVTMVTDGHSFIPGGRAEGEVDGSSVRLVAGDLEFVRIGDTEWLGLDGSFQTQPAQDVFAPFGEASKEVISAALASDDVTDLGDEELAGKVTRRYAIGLDDASRIALAGVPSSAQFWFVGAAEEEVSVDGSATEPQRFGFLEDADRIEVWLADGLIHQISVTEGDSSFTYTFYDFGDDITITPPE